MKAKFTILLVLLLIPALPFNTSAIGIDQNDGSPPAPIFESLNNTGNPENSHIYPNNTVITINYRADRFDVDGLILFGMGSNLTEDLNNPDFHRNFTLDSSFRANSFYSVELNITSYTYFYAYAWSGTLANGTSEELDLINDTPGHELWIEEGKLYPVLDEDQTTTNLVGDKEFYAARYSNVTFQYEVQNSENDTAELVTLVTAENETALFDSSTSTRYQMERVDYITGNFNFSVFELELNITDPIMYFTAFNDNGWSQTDANSADVYRITNGFSFNSTFDDSIYTTLDDIKFNITTFNETEGMSVGYQYRYFENSTSENPVINWTVVDGLTNSSGLLVNNTLEGTEFANSTLKRTYEADITDPFEVDNVVEIQQFVRYGTGSNITGDIEQFTILDPAPGLDILSANQTFSARVNVTLQFEFDTPKGEVTTATIDHLTPDNETKVTTNILTLDNATFSFAVSDDDDTLVEGNHTFVFNITNSLGISTVNRIIHTIDTTAPNGTITLDDPSNGATTDGRVTVSFSFEDEGVSPSGVVFATIDWDNNITINVTTLSEASHMYRSSGDYTITLTVYDKVGNMATFTVDVTVSLPERTSETDTRNTPLQIIPALFSIAVIAPILRGRQKK